LQIQGTTLKRIPVWTALTEITVAVFVLLSIVSILMYAPFWMVGGISKKRRRPVERPLRTLATCRCALHDLRCRDTHFRERRPHLAFGKFNVIICSPLCPDRCFCWFFISECLCSVDGASGSGPSRDLQLLTLCYLGSVDCYGLLCLLAHDRAEDLDLAFWQ